MQEEPAAPIQPENQLQNSSPPPEAPNVASETPVANWQFHDEASSQNTGAPAKPKQVSAVNWTASEFIEHSKNASWYVMLAGGILVLAAIVYLLTKDKVSAGVVVIVGIVFGILAARKPRELNYQVSQDGIQIGDKTYPYTDFKSFAIVQEHAIESIWLMPLKRFMPILSIYFDPADSKKITDVLGSFLPVEEHQLDPVDRLMHKIRF